ncbi:MAG: recombinase RecA, partial [Caldilineae bacterium]
MADKRIASGVPGLDPVLHGGMTPQQVYLIVGAVGAGKTVLALQWLREGLQRGDRCLFITLAEHPEQIRRNAAGFGWDLTGLDMVNLTTDLTAGAGDFAEYRVFPPSEVESTNLWQSILQAVETHRPQCLVIDSVNQLRYLATDVYHFRKHILALVNFLNRKGCTTMMTCEPSMLEQEASLALAADAVISLHLGVSENRVIGVRSLQVQKYRGSDFISGFHPMRITGEGIVLYPHLVEEPPVGELPAGVLLSGLPGLDELLEGGLETGSSTILTGPSGVGKSSLGMQFLATAGQAGKPGVLYTFEETAGSIRRRSRGLQIPVDALLDRGVLRIVPVNPMQFYPDEFLARLRAAVEEDGVQVVLLDSLRGYQLAMEEFGSLVAHVQNMVTYCRRQGVTLLVTNEIEHLVGDVTLTEIGVSYIFDNVILMRYAETQGRITHVISCLKKRMGPANNELREFILSGSGL